MKLYLAGPMTGLPDFNRPAFHEAAAKLRALGHEVINPAENPEPVRADGKPAEWADWMRLSIRQVTEADALAVLPGWSDSRGAWLEQSVATALRMPVGMVDDVISGGWETA